MLDRILASANPDGMLYNEFRPSDLKPLDEGLSAAVRKVEKMFSVRLEYF